MSKQAGYDIPRPEHPRPDFMRDTFHNLNGEWEFAFDDGDVGLTEGWYEPGHKIGSQDYGAFLLSKRGKRHWTYG